MANKNKETNGCNSCMYKDGFTCLAPSWYHRLCDASTVAMATKINVPEVCPDWLYDTDKFLKGEM